MPLHVRPFAGQDAVHDRIADRAVATGGVMADDAVFLGSEPFDGALGGEVEVVGAQADDLAADSLESVSEEQEFADCVHMRPLP